MKSRLCDVCDLPCASTRGVNIHKKKMHVKASRTQTFAGRKADKVVLVQINKLKQQQKDCPQVFCEQLALENVFHFPYLDSKFTADGDVSHDVEARIARALKGWGDHHHIFTSDNLSMKLKFRLYSAAVYSLMSYGCES